MMGMLNGLEDPFSEVGEIAEDLGIVDSDGLDEASDFIANLVAERGKPPETTRFLFGEPQEGTIPTSEDDTEDLITQTAHIVDNLIGGSHYGKMGAAALNKELELEKKRQRPIWLVTSLRCTEGLSSLWRCELELRRPEDPITILRILLSQFPGMHPNDALAQAWDFDRTDRGEGFKSSGPKIKGPADVIPWIQNSGIVRDITDAYNGTDEYVSKFMDPSKLDEFSDKINPDTIDVARLVKELTDHGTTIDPDRFLGKSCRVSINRRFPGDFLTLTERWFTGVGVEFEDLGYPESGWRSIRLVIAPRLELLNLRKNCRIFYGKNAAEIVKEIIDEHGLYQGLDGEKIECKLELDPGGWELAGPLGIPDEVAALTEKVAGAIPGVDGEEVGNALEKDIKDWCSPREHCVQYNETDLEFILRLLAEEGITFTFQHYERKEVLTLTNDPKLSGKKTMTLDRRSLLALADRPGESDLTTWEMCWNLMLDRQLVSHNVTLRDFNFTHPTSVTEVQANVDIPTLSGGMGVGSLVDTAMNMISEAGGAKGTEDYAGSESAFFEYPCELTLVPDGELGDEYKGVYKRYNGPALAQHRLEHLRVTGATARGASNVTTLLPGDNVKTRSGGFDILQDGVWKGNDLTGIDQKWLIKKVTHHWSEGTLYENTFEFVNAHYRYRPEQTVSRPRIDGLQTAIVIDVDSKDQGEDPVTAVHSDALHRVRLRFPWDRRSWTEGQPDEKAHSCWARVVQNFAGVGYGSVFTPRVGMEVLVAFIEGNPDRPLVVGCLYNGHTNCNAPPRRENAPPDYTADVRKTVTMIRSRSWEHRDPLRGNELRLDDHGALEEFRVFAQKNYNKTVHHDHITTVRLKQEVEVGNDQKEKVVADQTLEVNHESTADDDWARHKTVGKEETVKIGTPGENNRRGIVVHGDERRLIGKKREELITDSQFISIRHGRCGTSNPTQSSATSEGGSEPAEESTGGNEGANAAETAPAAGEQFDYARKLLVRGNQKIKVTDEERLCVTGDRKVTVTGAHEVKAEEIIMKTRAEAAAEAAEAAEAESSEQSGGEEGTSPETSSITISKERVEVKSRGRINMKAGETLSITSTENMVLIKAKTRINLQCGPNVIEMDGMTGAIKITATDKGMLKIGCGENCLELRNNSATLKCGDKVITATAAGDVDSEITHSGLVNLDFKDTIHFNASDVTFNYE